MKREPRAKTGIKQEVIRFGKDIAEDNIGELFDGETDKDVFKFKDQCAIEGGKLSSQMIKDGIILRCSKNGEGVD